MERVKRRWWTWAVSLVAAAVIFGAVISGLFQLAVLALPSYREDLSVWVTEVADRPVQIGGVSLVWRGVYPRLDLSDITLFTQAGDPALSAERLSLGFNLLRLLGGDVLPSRIELSGLSLAVEVDAQGKLRVRGFETAETPKDDWSVLVRRFRHVRLENCEVMFTDPRLEAQDWPFRLRRLDLEQSDRGFEFDGVMQLQSSLGGDVTFSADLSGALAQLDTWSGSFGIEASRVLPQGWLGRWLKPDAQIAAEALDLELEGELADGRLREAAAELDARALAVARGGRSRLWRQVRARAALRAAAGGGWQLEVPTVMADDADVLRGALRLQSAQASGAARALDVDADTVDLSALAPWFEIWRTPATWRDAAARAGGRLENVVLRLRPQGERHDYSLSARLREVSVREDLRFGLSGLNGEFSANQNGGRLTVDDGPLVLQLPSVLSVPAVFDRLGAQLQWQRVADGWRLRVPSFEGQLQSLKGRGAVTLELPADPAASPLIDLTAALSAGDVTHAKAFMPRHWPASLQRWLQAGIVAGRVPQAQLAIRGPLADFPYDRRPTGQWNLDIDTVGSTLSYAPDWPQIADIAATLRFSGSRLAIEARSGTVLGMPVQSGRAVFEDFHDARLRVEATVVGELARQYDFLRASPLRKPLAGLVDHTRAAGTSRVELQLQIPLHEVAKTTVAGTVAVDNAQLFYSALDSPVSGINGVVAFTERGVTAESLTARFEDLPLNARIEAREQTHGVVVFDFPFAPRAEASGASKFIPDLVRRRLSGQSLWRGELALRDQTALELSSDLQGLALDLPAPLGKSADAVVPLRLRIGSDAQAPLRVSMEYAQRLGLNLMLASREGALHLDGLHARLGEPVAPMAKSGGFLLDGRLAVLDLSTLGALAAVVPAEPDNLRLDLADLQVERLRWRAVETGPTRVRYSPRPGGWRLLLDGAAASGNLDWARASNAVTARLQRIDLRMLPADPVVSAAVGLPASGTAPAAASVTAPFDPGQWPQLDVECSELALDGVTLGQLSMRTLPIAGGQRLERLTLSGGEVQAQASGQWRRAESRSSAALRFKLDSSDIGGLLEAFNYVPNLEAKRSAFSGELEWAPTISGLQWTQPRGRIDADVEDGQLRAVQPGGARVLGLINFYALPRRLTLNFKDVVGEGLSFDRIHGGFRLGDGVATTDDLDIEAPSLRMEVRGDVRLAAREYDQRITVYPDVSAGVTLGAALLGGPAVGALVLLAQELLDKPLDQATQLSYRVTGGWDNPKVERADGGSDRPPSPATAAPAPAAPRPRTP